tara:strand:+ start:100 stop:963 length:864 start_codon:yes stop_codon:yes gene_type:complete
MKTIDTLVQDINALFDPLIDNELNEEKLEEHLETFTSSLKETITEFLKEKPRTTRNLRLSSIGRPTRQLWYDKNSKEEPRPLEPSTRIKFLYGHILEDLLILFCKLAGHKVTDQQKQVDVEGIKGHQDCMIDDVLVDCKSASGRSFEKFAKKTLYSDDPFGYIAQISAYAEGNGVDEAAFLAIDKQHGHICLTPVHSLEMINAKERIKYLKGIMDKDTPPDRCYSDLPDGSSGNRKLAIGCLYCPHKRTCWSDANQGKGLRVFDYAKGHRFLTNVSKEPNVEEIIDW